MIDGRELKKAASSPSPVTVCCETCMEARDEPDVIDKEIRLAWACRESYHGTALGSAPE